ncbi:hypothetical protein SEA_CHEETO1_22 [Microbacterium phage Cheeto1]|nr:hypothetical protein SEA_CHEETO1_22 [Microbacterium phage Cheeto1]
MAFLRTFGQLKPSKDVAGVAVKIISQSDAKVTDVQLNPGSSLFSWSPQVGDLALRSAPAWRYINGIIQSDYETWVMADEDLASPYLGRFDPTGEQEVQWGLLYLGKISSLEEFNGYEYSLSTGAGMTPHHTARADQRVGIETTGRMSAIIAIKGIHTDPGSNARSDLGTVTGAHPDGWSAVWAWHETWDDVLDEHEEWS